jgi:superfamily II DNA or RNA helicase
LIRSTLRPNQAEAVRVATPHAGFCLLQEQRVGKTLAACALIDVWKPSEVTVVCTKKARVVWEREISKHLKISWPCNIQTINFELLLSHKREWLRRAVAPNSLIIVDEAQNIKSRKSKQSKLIRTLAKRYTHRLALTGTAIAQGLHDAWAIFDFINPEIFGPWDLFEGIYCIKGGYKRREIVGYRNKDQFNEIFHRYSYRITLDEARAEAGLPPVKTSKILVPVTLSPETRRIYNELEDEMRAEVQEKEITTRLVITQAMRLHQLCGGNITGPDGEQIVVGTEKLDRLVYVLKEHVQDAKAVICCRYTWEIEAIERRCKRLGKAVSVISGKHKFTGEEAHQKSDIVIMQIQSGVAIDLAFARNLIFYSWNYSYLDFEQSRFRIIEFKTTSVRYFFLVAKDTIDEIMYEAVTRKKKFATLVLDHFRRKK